jgi:hypothetical protein
MPLTDTAIKKAKPGPSPAKLSDGKGMYLLVTESGSKLWRWKYRADGKAAIGLFQPIPINVISPLSIRVSSHFLCQSISSDTIQYHI